MFDILDCVFCRKQHETEITAMDNKARALELEMGKASGQKEGMLRELQEKVPWLVSLSGPSHVACFSQAVATVVFVVVIMSEPLFFWWLFRVLRNSVVVVVILKAFLTREN